MYVQYLENEVDQKNIDEKIKDIKKMDIFNCGDNHFSFVCRESGLWRFVICRRF